VNHFDRDLQPCETPDDADLVASVRAGDLDAYALIYQRHAHAALVNARRWARDEAAAQDLRAEAFVRMLEAIRRGRGPTGSVRPYLTVAIRNIAVTWARRERAVLPLGDMSDVRVDESPADAVLAGIERRLALKAYRQLPPRWRSVLKKTVIEKQRASRICAAFEINATAAYALAYRARERLKQAYLQAHITHLPSEECRPFVEYFGAFVRGRLASSRRETVRAHLLRCPECAALLAMIRDTNDALGGPGGSGSTGRRQCFPGTPCPGSGHGESAVRHSPALETARAPRPCAGD
jgi:RNA polymerase sigma factor (sigma-70 family)